MWIAALLLQEWDLLGTEKLFLEFVNQDIVPQMYQEVIKRSFPKLKDKLEKESKKQWYSWVRVRKTQLKVMSGSTIEIPTVYAQTDWKKSEGKNLSHEYLGIINWCSPFLVSDAVSAGLYAPSFQVACEILATRGIQVDDNKIASLTYKLADMWKKYRGKVSFQETENFVWKKVVMGLDGWRIRTRKQKRWRKKKSWRRWYNAERRETKSLVIAILDEEGKIEKKIKPFYDACIGTPDEFFEILALYLIWWEIGSAEQVCIVADWAKRIRDWVKKKLAELWVEHESITEVLDYCHAVQHLGKFIEPIKKLTSKQKKKLLKKWKTLLWDGKIEELLTEMRPYCRWRNAWNMGKEIRYLKNNKHRLNYALFRTQWLVCWSWIIESMIRRTTNLRLKWNWIFWTVPHAQKSLFLRSQLISWRWTTFMQNTLDLNRS